MIHYHSGVLAIDDIFPFENTSSVPSSWYPEVTFSSRARTRTSTTTGDDDDDDGETHSQKAPTKPSQSRYGLNPKPPSTEGVERGLRKTRRAKIVLDRADHLTGCRFEVCIGLLALQLDRSINRFCTHLSLLPRAHEVSFHILCFPVVYYVCVSVCLCVCYMCF